MVPFPRSPTIRSWKQRRGIVSSLVVCDFTGSTLAIKEGNEYDLGVESRQLASNLSPREHRANNPVRFNTLRLINSILDEVAKKY